jgi:hypothetical protein
MDAFDYVALGECFEQVPDGCIANNYTAKFEMTDRGGDEEPRYVPEFRGWERNS